MRAVAAAFVAAVALALPLPAVAATGSDTRATAPELWLGSAGKGAADTTTFSVETGEPLTTGPQMGCPRMAKTAWWKIRGNGHTLVISTAGSDMDTELAVYDGATLLKCHTDVNLAVDDRTSIVSIQNTVRGRWYDVQVGSQNRCQDTSPCYDSGDAVVAAEGFPRPSNDDRAAAITLPASNTASGDNTGATTEPGEATSCGSAPLSASVWFRWVAPATGSARFDARAAFSNVLQSANTVLAVYRGDGAPLGCNDDAAEFAGPSRVTLGVSAGDVFLLQVGAYGQDSQLTGEGPVTAQLSFQEDLDLDDDGFLRPADCNDANPAIHPGVPDVPENGVDEDCDGVDAVDFDRDRDGFTRPKDCRDDRRDINPGAVDKPGDRVDQDCDGRDAPWPVLSVRIAGGLALFAKYTKFTELAVYSVPAAGTRVHMSCKGRGCPFKARTLVTKRPMRRLDLLRAVKKAKFRHGTRLEVRVQRKGYVGRLARWTTRAPKGPQRIDRCLIPRKKTPVRC